MNLQTSVDMPLQKQWYCAMLYGLNPKNRPDLWIIAVIALIFLIYLLTKRPFALNEIVEQKTASDYWGFILDVVTMGVIVIVWISDVVSDWKAHLQKYLSVNFVYGDEMCIKIPPDRLTSESDIRAMAQAMGKSWNNENLLPLNPSVKYLVDRIQFDSTDTSKKNSPFVHYMATIELKKKITTPAPMRAGQ